MRAQGFTCLDLASGNVDFASIPLSLVLLYVAGIRLDETCLHISTAGGEWMGQTAPAS